MSGQRGQRGRRGRRGTTGRKIGSGSGESILTVHGGYRSLRSFQVAQLAYDLTVRFCERYVPRGSRTRDQIVQAARSGVQNIAEASEASATSKQRRPSGLGTSTGSSGSTPSTFYPEFSANAGLTLTTVAGYLLDRQVQALATSFEKEGGFTERLYRVRTQRRSRT